MYGRPLERLCDDDVGSLPFFGACESSLSPVGSGGRHVVFRVQEEGLRDLD